MTTRIVIASNNQGKVNEFKALFDAWSIETRSQAEFDVPDVEEAGLSFVENAIIKARNACRHTGLPAIADDSGLAVDALNGAPGIYSARYSKDLQGDAANDSTNNIKLLANLEAVEDDKRTAQFICALVYMRHVDDPVPIIAIGEWRGRILREPRGNNGFGYDPLFFVEAQGRTSAELAPETKNRISHRGIATAALLHELKQHGCIDD